MQDRAYVHGTGSASHRPGDDHGQNPGGAGRSPGKVTAYAAGGFLRHFESNGWTADNHQAFGSTTA